VVPWFHHGASFGTTLEFKPFRAQIDDVWSEMQSLETIQLNWGFDVSPEIAECKQNLLVATGTSIEHLVIYGGDKLARNPVAFQKMIKGQAVEYMTKHGILGHVHDGVQTVMRKGMALKPFDK
jgi:hypothetical protein